MKNKINYKLVNLLLIVLIICLLYLIRGLWLGILTKIIAVIFPFLIAFAVAYALYPYCKKLEDYGLPKWLAMGVIYFIIIGFLIILGITIIPMFYDQVVLFLSNISAVITDISSKFEIDLGIEYLGKHQSVICPRTPGICCSRTRRNCRENRVKGR